jgi:DNA recombination-dependent growth factor C
VDELDSQDEGDPLARFDANYAFMAVELARMLPALEKVFG